MFKKINFSASLVCISIFLSGNALAQFPNLKDLAEKLKQAQQQVTPPQGQQPQQQAPQQQVTSPQRQAAPQGQPAAAAAPAPTPATEQRTSSSAQTQSSQPASQTNSVAAFRERFCKSIDATVSPPPNFSYRDISTGDICKFPNEVLSEIIRFSTKAKVDIVAHPGGTITLTSGPHQGRIISGDYKFQELFLVVNQFTSKVYVGNMELIVCREDSSNSMDEGSSFRKALDQKFGKPGKTATEYDEMQQNAKAMEAEIAEKKKKVGGVLNFV